MNKYQEFAIKSAVRFDYERSDKNVSLSSFEWDYKTVTVVQNENYNIRKYNIYLLTAVAEKVEYILKGQTYIVKDLEKNKYLIELDYDKRIEKIKIHFSNSVVDPVEIPIVYVEADVKKYDEKVMAEHKKALEKNAKITISTGIDLVNIYFQPCSDDYGKTVIVLYTANGKWQPHPHVMGRGEVFKPKLLGAEVALLMGKFTVEDGMFFKSIGGLAKGAYGYRLSQYNTKGELLFSTDYAYFAIYN